MRWRLVITPKVQGALRPFSPQTKHYIREALDEVRHDPQIGKPLRDEFTGLYSFRARRFRIIYKIEHQTITIVLIDTISS